jgi:hypothetical protein
MAEDQIDYGRSANQAQAGVAQRKATNASIDQQMYALAAAVRYLDEQAKTKMEAPRLRDFLANNVREGDGGFLEIRTLEGWSNKPSQIVSTFESAVGPYASLELKRSFSIEEMQKRWVSARGNFIANKEENNIYLYDTIDSRFNDILRNVSTPAPRIYSNGALFDNGVMRNDVSITTEEINEYAKKNPPKNRAVSLFPRTIEDGAAKKNRSVADETSARLGFVAPFQNVFAWADEAQMMMNENDAKPETMRVSQPRAYNRSLQNAPKNENGERELNGYQQIEEALKGVFTDAQLKEISIDLSPNVIYSDEAIGRAEEMMDYVYNKGLSFNPYINPAYPEALSIRLDDRDATEIRILDNDLTYIGRVHGREYGDLYYRMQKGRNGANVKLPDDPTGPLRYRLGEIEGRLDVFKGGNAQVRSRELEMMLTLNKVNKNSDRMRLEERRIKPFNTAQDAREVIDKLRSSAIAALEEKINALNEFGLFEPSLEDEIIEAQTMKQYSEDYKVATLEDILAKAGDDESVQAAIKNYYDYFEGMSKEEYDETTGRRAYPTVAESAERVIGYMDSEGVPLSPHFILANQTAMPGIRARDVLIQALKTEGIKDVATISIENFTDRTVVDQLVEFDPTGNVSQIDSEEDPVRKGAMNTVRDELERSGIRVSDVLLDEQGIIRWSGERQIVSQRGDITDRQQLTGDIGQVFTYDEHGILTTQFNSGDNFGVVPGYDLHFEFNGLNEAKPRMERLRAIGYEQRLDLFLKETVREQAARIAFEDEVNGERQAPSIQQIKDSTSLNRLYRGGIASTRIELDWYDQTHLDDDVKDAILDGLRNKGRFGNEYGKMATTNAAREADSDEVSNEGYAQTRIFALADKKNMRILEDDYVGYLDMDATGTGAVQGLAVYLTKGATVDAETGVVTPVPFDGDIKNAPSMKLTELDYFKYKDYMPWDRQQMAINQLLTAKGVAKEVRTARLNFFGWNMDDAYVVSKEFAEANKVKDRVTGEMRALIPGDKLSDFGGNKGVISLIVDPDMSEEEAKRLDLVNEVAFYKANKGLDVITSPYGSVSRKNAAVERELQDSEIHDVVDPKTGEVLAQSGTLNIIITEHLANKKTNVYDEEAQAEGKGRKFSGQLTWAMAEEGATGILSEVFGENETTWANLREYLIVTGMDMKNDGSLRLGYEAHPGEERNVFSIDPSIEKNAFVSEVATKGGLLEIPDDLLRIMKKQSPDENGLYAINPDGFEFPNGVVTTKIPMMSAALRRENVLIDGSVKTHDYTKHIESIYENLHGAMYGQEKQKVFMEAHKHTYPSGKTVNRKAGEYVQFNDEGKPIMRDLTDSERLDRLAKVQKSFDAYSVAVMNDKLGGIDGQNKKHSYIRDNVMAVKMKNSATAIVTPDLRLKIEEVYVGKKIWDNLNVRLDKDGKAAERVGVFRDPIITSGAFRGFIPKLHPDETFVGIAVNPTIGKSMEMDYDGDTLGIMKFKTKAAQEELATKFNPHHNLKHPGIDSGEREIYLNVDTMDGVTGVITTTDPKLKWVDNGEGVNDQGYSQKEWTKSLYENIAYDDSLTPEVKGRKVNQLVQKLVRQSVGGAGIMLESDEAIVESVSKIAASGAKGKLSAVTGAKDDNGVWTEPGYVTYFTGEATRQMKKDVQFSTGMKTDDTGIPGTLAGMFMAQGRNISPAAANRVAAQVTQTVLQIKHDAPAAVKIDKGLARIKNVVNGYYPDKQKDKKGNPLRLTATSASKILVKELDGLGIGISQEHADKLFDTVRDPKSEAGYIYNLKDGVKKVGAPLDILAYAPNAETWKALASEGRNLTEGEMTGMFAPRSIREAKENSMVARKDVIKEPIEKSQQKQMTQQATSAKEDTLEM